MDVELCLRKTCKEESARPEGATNNLFPLGAVHVTVKEDAMIPLIGFLFFVLGDFMSFIFFVFLLFLWSSD